MQDLLSIELINLTSELISLVFFIEEEVDYKNEKTVGYKFGKNGYIFL